MATRFRILSLSGGGYLGLFTAKLLVQLEARYGYPLAKKFDLIAGTSIGGLLTIALAKQIPAKEIAALFESGARQIFRSSIVARGLDRMGMGALWKSQFRVEKLSDLITAIVGTDTNLGSLESHILIPAFNLSTGKPYEFRNSLNGTPPSMRLVDIALATTAAPTFFPVHAIGDQLFADGGMHANTPDIVSISEAMAEYGAQIDCISMVSIGVTFSRRPIGALRRRNLGKIGWFRQMRIIDRLLEAQNQNSVFLSDRMLRERYIRINKFLAPSIANQLHLARTDGHATKLLVEAAERSWNLLMQNVPKRQRLDRILKFE